MRSSVTIETEALYGYPTNKTNQEILGIQKTEYPLFKDEIDVVNNIGYCTLYFLNGSDESANGISVKCS